MASDMIGFACAHFVAGAARRAHFGTKVDHGLLCRLGGKNRQFSLGRFSKLSPAGQVLAIGARGGEIGKLRLQIQFNYYRELGMDSETQQRLTALNDRINLAMDRIGAFSTDFRSVNSSLQMADPRLSSLEKFQANVKAWFYCIRFRNYSNFWS